MAVTWRKLIMEGDTSWVDLTDGGATTLHKHDHGGQDGLDNDDHAQYALLAGRATGQSLIGGTASGDDLTLESTSHATKGYVNLQPNGGRVGIGTAIPGYKLNIYDGTDSTGVVLNIGTATKECYFFMQEAGNSIGGFEGFGSSWGDATRANGIAVTASVANSGSILFITRTGTTYYDRLKIANGGDVGIGATPAISDGSGTAAGLHIAGKILRLATSKTPASAGATGNIGEICWDTSYMYVATAANTWERMPLIPWTYERHIQIPAVADGTAANQATPIDFYTAGGLQFPTSGTKYAYCQWEVPDDWDGTNVYFEIDWFPDSGAISGTAAVRWTVEYRAIAEGEAINNGTSVTLDNGAGGDTGDYSQYVTKHTRVTLVYNNANQPLTKQDHVYFKISRDTAVANDFGGSVTVTAYEIIYNSVGYPTSN